MLSLVTIIYAALTICSLAVLAIYIHIFKSKLNKKGLIVFIAVCITNFGYFLLSCSKSLSIALWANRIAYFGSILLVFELFFVINDFCDIKIKKYISYILFVLTTLVFILTMTAGTSVKLYYNDVQINIVDGVTTLSKQYGRLHHVYLVYVVVMYVSMIISIAYSIIKKKTKLGVNPIVLMLIIGENIFIWLVEKRLNVNMEILSISYLFNEILVLLLYKNIDEFDKFNNKQLNSIDDVVTSWSKDYQLTEREIQILQLLIENVARSDIAQRLFISEHTVKKHTTHIYEKLCVSSRNDLLYKLNEEISK